MPGRVGEDEAKPPAGVARGGHVSVPLIPRCEWPGRGPRCGPCRAAPHGSRGAGPPPAAPRAGRDSPRGAGDAAGASWRPPSCRAPRRRRRPGPLPAGGMPCGGTAQSAAGVIHRPGVTRSSLPPRPASRWQVPVAGLGMLRGGDGGAVENPPSSSQGEWGPIRSEVWPASWQGAGECRMLPRPRAGEVTPGCPWPPQAATSALPGPV